MAEIVIKYRAEVADLTAEINKINEANSEVEKSAIKTAKVVATTFQDAAKTSAAAFASPQIKAALQALNKESSELVAALKKLDDEQEKLIGGGKRLSDEFKKNAAEQARLKKELSNVNNELKKYETTTVETTKKSEPLTRTLRGLKNEILALEEAGDVTSQRFRNLVAESARLEDQIGDTRTRISNLASDTLKFDAGLQAVQGLAAGFEVVQGTAALFGAENEELQKSLLKVQGAMAVANGLQQISNLLLEESKLKTVALTIAQRVYAAAVALTSGALKGLKVALAATGVGALLVALGAVVAYWDDIKALITGVSAEQEKLNETTKKKLETLDEELKLLELQENSLKLQGKTEEDIIKLKQIIIQQSIKQAKIDIQNAKTVKTQQVENSKLAFEVLKGIGRVSAEIYTSIFRLLALGIDAVILVYDELAEKIGFSKIGTTINEQISILNEGVTDFAANLIFDPEATAKEGDKAVAEAELRLAELESTNNGYTLKLKEIEKERTDNANAANKERADKAADAAKKSAEDQLKARERLAQLENEAFITQLSEQEKILNESNAKIIEAEKAFTEARYKAGTKEAIQAEKDLASAIQAIKLDANKRIAELDKKDLEASVTKQLEAAKAGADATTQQQITALQTQRDIELANAEALGKDKVEITTRYNTQIADLNKQLAQSEYNTRVDNLKALELVEGSSLDRRLELINIEAARRKKEATDTIKDKEELDAKLKLIEAETQATIREERAKTAKQQADEVFTFIDNFTGLTKGVIDLQRQQSESAIANIEAEREKSLEVINNSIELEAEKERQRLALNKKVNAEIAQQKRKAAIADKALAIFEATINTARAVTAALTSTPPNIPLSIIVGATGALQIATIASKPIPKFARGGLIGGRLHSGGGTLIEAERDEYIINRAQSMKHRRELDAINTSSEAFRRLIDERYVRPAISYYLGNKERGVTVKASLNSKTMEKHLKAVHKEQRRSNRILSETKHNTNNWRSQW